MRMEVFHQFRENLKGLKAEVGSSRREYKIQNTNTIYKCKIQNTNFKIQNTKSEFRVTALAGGIC